MLFNNHDKQHIFKVCKGTARLAGQREPAPVIFSEEFGNLTDMTITDDESVFKNVAYVAGGGEGADRRIVIVGAAYGLERREVWVDARDLQPDESTGETVDSPSYLQNLVNRGRDKLNERVRITTFSAEVDSRDFRVKYDLGDLVTCKSSKYGIQINSRITQFKEVTENNMTRTMLTLGEPEMTLIKEMKLQNGTA